SPKNKSTLSYTFTTAPRTYYIVGRIVDTAGKPIAGVTVTLSGAASKSTATDGNGYYAFRDLRTGDYTVTPTKSGWTFTPANRRYTGLAQDVDNADFVGSLPTYALSGRVTLGGAGLQGVTITVDGKTTVTGSDGTWRIANLPAGAYTVVPSLANYQFNPASRTATIVNADIAGLDFEALPSTFTISGTVTDSAGDPLEGVVVNADGRTAVTAANGRYQIGGITAGTVNVTCQKAGYTFFWRDGAGNWQSGARAVTVPPDQTGVDFVGYTVVSQQFAGGLHLISVPCVPRDASPAVVFGTDRVARYDPSAVPPRYLTARSSPNAEQLRVRPGRGFWVMFSGTTNLQIPGTPVPTDEPVTLAAPDGWNMFGNPWLQRLPVDRITALSGSIRPFVYTWDPIRATYLLIAAEPGVGIARDYVLPWEGMWVRALGLSTVSIGVPGGPFEARQAEALQLDLGADGWWLAVEARAGDRADHCCAVGVRSTGPALAVEKPPAMPNSVYVAVTSATGEALSRSVLASGRTSYEWDLVVTTDIPDTDVAVALPDLSKLPKDLQVTLTDLETGKSVYMRTTSQYVFRSGPEGATRHLRLTVAPKSVGGLVLSGVSATAAGSRVTVSYSATAPCAVTARVLNIAGRVVRVIATNAPAGVGVNTLAWDGRNAAGSPVPAGRYLIELDAVAENGQRVKCVTHVTLASGR
ncbi:MAG: carboxypeptidase regulatory-like domain-containing protein, partial [Armatimonadetes bacterium]|nr:carboxypeptidase regulatory-like domain-containing protein [Armatimonadota bacterium]